MVGQAASATVGKQRCIVEVVVDMKRDIVVRWSGGREQTLPLQLDLPEAVRCLVQYLESGTY